MLRVASPFSQGKFGVEGDADGGEDSPSEKGVSRSTPIPCALPSELQALNPKTSTLNLQDAVAGEIGGHEQKGAGKGSVFPNPRSETQNPTRNQKLETRSSEPET